MRKDCSEIVCEEKANLTRLKRVRRKEGGLGSDSLWKGHSEARSVCEKMEERWFWNEESYRSHVKKGEEIVRCIIFFSK